MRNLIKHSLVYLVGDLLVRAGSFVLIPLYTRTLTRTDYGMVALTSVIATVVSYFSGLSLGTAVLKLNPEYRARKNGPAAADCIAKFAIIWGIFMAVLLLLVGPPILARLFKEGSIESYGRIGIGIGCFSGVTNALLAVFQSNQEPMRYRLVTLCGFVANLATGIVAVVHLKMGGTGAALGQLAGAGSSCVLALLTSGIALRTTIDSGILYRALKIGLPLTLYSIGGFSTDQLSRVFVERYVSVASLGVYNIAYLYCTILGLVFGAVNTAWAPKFFEGGSGTKNVERSGRYGAGLIISAVGMAGIMSILAADILGLAVGRDYQDAQKLVPVLMINAVLSIPVWTVVMNPLVLMEKNWWITWCALVSGLCNILLNFILTRHYGAEGAAWSSTGSLLVLVGLTGAISLRVFKVKYDYKRIFLAGILAILMGWIAEASRSFVFPFGVLARIGAVFAVGLGVFKLMLQMLSHERFPQQV
jgi:O-antigen/teichoic acid export membrane protein